VSAPTASARDSRVGAASRTGASADARTADRGDRSTDASDATVVAAAATPAAEAVAAAAPAPAPIASSDPSASAMAAIAPTQQTAPAAAVAAPAPVAPTLVATTDPSVAQQLQGPLLSLRSAPEGEHVLVVRVSPDHLGPVTVHATVSHGDLTVQLFAATGDAREALKSMMTDLRRDLGAGAAGSATSLSLGSGDAPQQEGRGQQAATAWLGAGTGGPGGGSAREDRLTWGPAPRDADEAPTDRRTPSSSSALLDVLA
jgi:flagellar hook-length control protein FliK